MIISSPVLQCWLIFARRPIVAAIQKLYHLVADIS